MSLLTLERLLAEQIGLDVEAIGRRTFDAVVQHRMASLAVTNRDDYYGRVLTDAAEREELIESIVVPETWFFRDTEPFRLLARHVTRIHARDPQSSARKWRVLSLPCATGEEAYSTAITLIDAGVQPHAVEVVGVDISHRSLEQARAGVYAARSFRCVEGDWWKQYFTAHGTHGRVDSRRVAEPVRNCVRFLHGNALDPSLLSNDGVFDFVFCRNLLIYLTPAARRAMAQQFARWLREGGLLFLGHAEATDAPNPEFRPVDPPSAFAFVRAKLENSHAVDRWESLLRSSHIARKQRAGKAPRFDPVDADRVREAAPQEKNAEWSDASLLADRGELAAATDLCERLISRKGASARGYCLLGVVHQAGGRLVDAEACFVHALEIDPVHHESLVHLMFLCERDGRAKQAAELKRRVELATPKGRTP